MNSPRLYQTKGDDAKRHHLTVPLSIRLLDRLKRYAAELGRPPTSVAHDLIEAGVPATDEKREKA